MSDFSLRPAIREDTPIILGIIGPTKSGKTYSALELAMGLAEPSGRPPAMLNAEGARGHQYADRFKYLACDIKAPFSYARYGEALEVIAAGKPGAIVIDSMSHAHDGPGGMLEQHDSELDRMAGKDFKKRDRMNFTAWIKPKAEENAFIYQLLGLDIPIVLCFRAKEKLKIVPGKDPVNLGYQPISSDRIAFETLFDLMLPPFSKGVPDLEHSHMREPFDKMVPGDQPITRELGRKIAQWAAGEGARLNAAKAIADTASLAINGVPAGLAFITVDQVIQLTDECKRCGVTPEQLCAAAKVDAVAKILASNYQRALAWVRAHVD